MLIAVPFSRRFRWKLRSALVLATVAVACSSSTDPRLPDENPVIRGVIVSVDVTHPSYPVPNIHVKGAPELEEDCGAVVVFERDPVVYRRTEAGRLLTGSRDDLIVGRTAEVWIPPHEGIEDICPWYLGATVIVVE